MPNPDTFTKPVHPFADRLLQQGLLLDTVRGVTSSSARREIPSQVFGISTPGPMDTSVNAPRKAIGFVDGETGAAVRIPVSRLGGTQFVMDDGDKDGQNELVRIRTRTGHQILLHNSSDLIYIGNSKGTAWVELTSNGKIDVYAEDSISIHSEQDINMRADRDFNIEAGRNFRLAAYSGIQMEATDRFYLTCDNEGKINIANNLQITAGAEIRTKSGDTTSMIAGVDFRAEAGTNLNLESGAVMNQYAGTDWKVSAGGGSNITSSEHRETAGRIEMNGPAANAAANAGANSAETPVKLETFNLPSRSSGSGWTNGNFYKAGDIVSIMQRVPMHEPWDQHENINPDQFTPAKLDTQVNAPADTKTNPSTSDAAGGAPQTNSAPVAVPLSKNAAANEQYLQAVLVNGGVTDPIKLAAWMAQCKVESAGFRALKEFASGAEYEGRKDLGNTQSGDGIRFKGRGFIQCTGRDNYKSMSSYFKLDFISKPELLEQLEWAAKSVLWFFNVYKKSRTASVDWNDCTAVTKIVNGGTNALAQRKAAFDYYKAKFQSEGIQPTGVVDSAKGG